jgi:opacity protein-like surface antigen
MKKFIFAAILTCLLSLSAAAQGEIPKVELYGGYSWAGGNFHGWNASVTGNVNSWLGVTADFSGHYGGSREGNIFEERQRAHSFLFGPRFSARKRKRVSPFAYALFGVSHLKTRETLFGNTFTASDSGFAMALGGGLDIKVNERVAVRAFQLDFFRPVFFGEAENRGRLSFGLVLRFGKR